MSFVEGFNIEKEAAAMLCGGEKMTLAMAYVPVQEWGDLYTEDAALQNGTLFPALDKPFLGGKQVQNGKR